MSGDCPCGSGLTYDACCGPIHRDGAGLGATAESLMRARYSAFVLDRDDFVLGSWHPDTRPGGVGDSPDDHEWLGLEILYTTAGGALDSEGTVEFTARFRRGQEHYALHERSTFTRVSGKWMYVDGVDASD